MPSEAETATPMLCEHKSEITTASAETPAVEIHDKHPQTEQPDWLRTGACIEEYVAAKIVLCKTSNDLRDVVEALFDDDGYYNMKRNLLENLPFNALLYRVDLSSGPPERIVKIAGKDNRELVEEIDQLMRVYFRAISQFFSYLFKLMGDENNAKIYDEIRRGLDNPFWFLDDPSIPIPIVDALMAQQEEDILFFGLSGLEGKYVPPDVLRELLLTLVRDLKKHLGLVAVLPGVNVPYPFPLDPQRIEEEHEQAEKAYQARLEMARQRGGSVNFALDNDD